jgi:hypothetical protein
MQETVLARKCVECKNSAGWSDSFTRGCGTRQALLSDKFVRNATIASRMRTDLLVLSRQSFQDLIVAGRVHDQIDFQPRLLQEKLAAAASGDGPTEAVGRMMLGMVREKPTLRDIPAAVLATAVRDFKHFVVRQRDAVFDVNEPAKKFYYVIAGSVDIVAGSTLLRTVGPCEVFGEVELMLSLSTR